MAVEYRPGAARAHATRCVVLRSEGIRRKAGPPRRRALRADGHDCFFFACTRAREGPQGTPASWIPRGRELGAVSNRFALTTRSTAPRVPMAEAGSRSARWTARHREVSARRYEVDCRASLVPEPSRPSRVPGGTREGPRRSRARSPWERSRRDGRALFDDALPPPAPEPPGSLRIP